MQSTTQNCPHCGKENPALESYCYSCGHILPSALENELPGATYRLEEKLEKLTPSRRWGTAYFDQERRIQLTLRESGAVVLVRVVDSVTVGRSHEVPGSPQPDVDLQPHGAFEQGVSRVHVAFKRELDTLSVTDLGSANGTYLNGQKLLAHDARILRDNDELRLGRMVMRVAFV